MTEAKRTRRRYNADQKDAAVALARDVGLANAGRELAIPKSTIKGWAVERGIEVSDEALVAKTEKATAMSRATRKQKVSETKDRLTLLLAAIAELGAHAQIAMLQSGAISLAEAVGATTRAIHDLQLLDGNPTEITEELDTDGLLRLQAELQARVGDERKGLPSGA